MRAIIDVGDALERRVASEGAKDRLKWELLRKIGRDCVHINRPMPDVENLLWMLDASRGSQPFVLM